MALPVAREIHQAIVNGKPVPDELRNFVVNENPLEVRLLSIKDEKVRVYSGEAADHQQWDPYANLVISADSPVQIARSPAHPTDHAVKLFFSDEAQLYTAELGRTFVFDGSTLITVFPRELPK
uniref:Uncharacterized protein n=1 Tax=Neobodo designis TaxID=312471 RepID=A0A6U4PQU9_NEODS|mmetsp:Transcript_14705/g.45585  ORF Transcript_14705/g.45585 Transcript_14705/m.45585 type:complete len:123 (+) Transcript_14705:35-403(+)